MADLSIIDLMQELRRRYGRTASYVSIWRRVIEGQIPSHRDGRLNRIRVADVPAIAATLGLTPTSDLAA